MLLVIFWLIPKAYQNPSLQTVPSCCQRFYEFKCNKYEIHFYPKDPFIHTAFSTWSLKFARIVFLPQQQTVKRCCRVCDENLAIYRQCFEIYTWIKLYAFIVGKAIVFTVFVKLRCINPSHTMCNPLWSQNNNSTKNTTITKKRCSNAQRYFLPCCPLSSYTFFVQVREIVKYFCSRKSTVWWHHSRINDKEFSIYGTAQQMLHVKAWL